MGRHGSARDWEDNCVRFHPHRQRLNPFPHTCAFTGQAEPQLTLAQLPACLQGAPPPSVLKTWPGTGLMHLVHVTMCPVPHSGLN